MYKLIFLLTAVLVMTSCSHTKQSQSFPEVAQLKAQPELPDPLVMMDGSRVTSAKDWNEKRRPELKALFQHYMYGYFPPRPKISTSIEREDRNYFGGKATKREVLINYGPAGAPPIHLLVVIPNSKKPAPVFVGPNFQGNHTVLNDRTITLPAVWMPKNGPGVVNNKATDAGRGKQIDVWNIEASIDRGYAVATFYCGDTAPDHPGFTDGIHPHYQKPGEPRGPHDWATIAGWAFGVQRCVDYLVTDRDIDASRIAAVGHSRLGKTVLLAAAFDERIAITIPLQAGCGGTAPSRGKIGESVTRINTSFPHWFCDEFKKFNDRPELIPFDQHCLVALMAPRPVFFPNAIEDQWANPAGQFDVLKAADPVYRLLGSEGIGSQTMPETNSLLNSKLGYFIRPGKHAMTPDDWKVFWAFADKWMKNR